MNRIPPAVLLLLFSAALSAEAARGPRGPKPPPAGPDLQWHCNEAGAAPTLADASGKGRAGKPAGGVRGGARSPSGTAVGAFADETCFFSADLPRDGKDRPATPREWTFQCFFRDPMPLTNRVALVARGAGEAKGDVPWQLWIERSGEVCLGVQDSKGATEVERKEGIAWKRGEWYHAVVARSLESRKGDETWDEHYRVWIAPAGDPVGDPAIDRHFVFKARVPASARLEVGGGAKGRHPKAAPGGALGPAALVDEISFWPRALSADELAAARAAFGGGAAGGAASAAAAAAPGQAPLLRWEFEEIGKAPLVAKDSSPEKRDGTANDRIRGGAQGRKGGTKAFEGFGSERSFVLSGPLPEGTFRKEWTLAMWMKNPRLSSKQACVLAGAAPDGKSGDIPWQVWLDAKGAPHVAMQDGKGKRHVKEGKPFRWEPNRWHLVVIAHLPDKDPFGQASNRFRVWVVPEAGRAGEPLFDDILGWGSLMAQGDILQVGAAEPGKGKRAEIAPGGYFGGMVDEVVLYPGFAAKDPAQIDGLRSSPAR